MGYSVSIDREACISSGNCVADSPDAFDFDDDDIALARWLSPQLTTVHQTLRRMGEEAARLVIRLAAGESVETLRMDLATHLVVRGSTAPPAP